MIVTHSLVMEWLRHFVEGRTLCGYNEQGVWWDDSRGSTHVTEWSEVEDWGCDREFRAHCEHAADSERGD